MSAKVLILFSSGAEVEGTLPPRSNRGGTLPSCSQRRARGFVRSLTFPRFRDDIIVLAGTGPDGGIDIDHF